MGIHDGHRQRLKDRFRQEGLDGFNDINALELLLCYSIPRRDVNPVAHALLERFGSFTRVLEAAPEELESVAGIGRESATFLPLITAAGRIYRIRSNATEILHNTEEYGMYLMPYFVARPNETVFLLCLDAKSKVICCKHMGEGGVNSAGIPIPKLVAQALASKASSVILAHNHPSGVAAPSPEDIASTLRLQVALNTVEIILVDHVIFAGDDFVSLAQSGDLIPLSPL